MDRFGDKLQRFSDSLGKRDRKVLMQLLAGAVAANRFSRSLRGVQDRRVRKFFKLLEDFVDSLPRSQQKAARAMFAAGAMTDNILGNPDGKGLTPIYFWHYVHLARTIAVLITGAVVVIDEATEGEDPSIPQIPDIPSDEVPEFP